MHKHKSTRSLGSKRGAWWQGLNSLGSQTSLLPTHVVAVCGFLSFFLCTGLLFFCAERAFMQVPTRLPTPFSHHLISRNRHTHVGTDSTCAKGTVYHHLTSMRKQAHRYVTCGFPVFIIYNLTFSIYILFPLESAFIVLCACMHALHCISCMPCLLVDLVRSLVRTRFVR